METTTQPTHMETIKAGIWDIHEGVATEVAKPEPEENLMKGTLPRYKYVNSVKQRYLLQKAFEEVLADYREHPFVGAVVTDEQFHADKAAEDLRYFGVDPESVVPVPETGKMIVFFRETASRDPRLLLAIHYVIEGSNNGAMYIAQAVKKAYDLEGTNGTFHLQPYGSAVRDKWKAFGESFNSLDISESLMAEMIAVGRQTFFHMNAIVEEACAQPEG